MAKGRERELLLGLRFSDPHRKEEDVSIPTNQALTGISDVVDNEPKREFF
jgi:hypothetical protein